MTLSAVLLEIRYPWIDPVALDLPGPLAIRWYSLAYLAGFLVAYLVVRRLAREGFLAMDPEAAGDLITALVLGVILGGRLGYILFYDFPEFARNPARIVRIWEGGLSFHGGLIGVVVATWWFTRRHGLSFLRLGDALALAIPFGLFFGRLANFINGELFGRVAAPGVPWAMRFPTDPEALALIGAGAGGMRAREAAVTAAYRSGLWDQVRPLVPLRHPSQLYEALGEGVLLALILWTLYLWVRRRGRILPAGTYGGVFLLGYALVRVFVELFRQPDPQFRGPGDPLGTVLGPLTMGQTLSAGMLVIGAWLVLRGIRLGTEPAPAPFTAAAPGHGSGAESPRAPRSGTARRRS